MKRNCWNNITVVCEEQSELHTLIRNELMHTEQNELMYTEQNELMCTEQNIYRLKQHINVIQNGKLGIRILLMSTNKPDFAWLSGLLDKYTSIWIKNEWDEPGGYSGVWVGYVDCGIKNIKKLEWLDLCPEATAVIFKRV